MARIPRPAQVGIRPGEGAAVQSATLKRLAVGAAIFVLVLLLLPATDEQTAARWLRDRVLVDGLLRQWEEQVAVAGSPSIGFGQWLHSRFAGEEILPPPRPVRLWVEIESLADHCGGEPWTLEDLLAHPSLQSFTTAASDPGVGFWLRAATPGGGEATPGWSRVALSVGREGDAVVARASGADGEPASLELIDERGVPYEGVSCAADARREFPRPWSLIPPVLAIICAVVTRSALLSLLLGVFSGGLLLAGFGVTGDGVGDRLAPFWAGCVRTEELFRAQIVDDFRISIVLFIVFLIGMIGVLTKVGGTQGLVSLLTRRSQGARSTRVVAALCGFLVFFDDYSNSVIVGSTMRPLTDRMRIAREKLAYIIDSTAAPVAGIALFSTWIGYEVTQYQSALALVDPEEADKAYQIFLATIPYRFYCIFTLAFVLWNVFSSRDFGPMLKAERRAAESGEVIARDATPLASRRFSELRHAEHVTPRARDALIPLAVVLVVMVVGFWFVGLGWPAFAHEGWGSLDWRSIAGILNNDYNMQAAVAASFFGSVVAIFLALPRLGLGATLRAWGLGLHSLLLALGILLSAWALAAACGELQADAYLATSVAEGLPLWVQPVVFFLLACAVAFATGTSWGTMAILLPISIPIVYHAEHLGDASITSLPVTLLSFGAVLEGAIFGDHCSPISDTTVLSSVAAGSDHLDHVRTQIPYALTTMAIALFVGYLPIGLGWYGSAIAIPIGILVCGGVLFTAGRRLSAATPPRQPGREGSEA